jgi:pyruvate,water dikinase
MSAVAWFKDVGIADRPTVGGKGGSLGELTRAGIAVPPGFVVTTSGFEQFLEAIEAHAPVRARVEALDPSDLGAATKLSEELRRRVIEEPMPAGVEQAIRAAHAELSPNGEPVAVRSSATTEDAEDASFAGLQDTFLWVLGADQMVARVRECWGSLYSVESMTYRRKHAIPEDGVAMAVVVQRMVDAKCAGVMFTRSPTTGDKSVITIEGAWGLGSAVVSGEVTPDRWVVGKITGEISVRDISDKHARQVPSRAAGSTRSRTRR